MMDTPHKGLLIPKMCPLASHQIREIAGCACAGNAGNILSATDVRDAHAVMHAGIANPRWRGKRSRHSRRMSKSQFDVSGKRPMSSRKKNVDETQSRSFKLIPIASRYPISLPAIKFHLVRLRSTNCGIWLGEVLHKTLITSRLMGVIAFK